MDADEIIRAPLVRFIASGRYQRIDRFYAALLHADIRLHGQELAHREGELQGIVLLESSLVACADGVAAVPGVYVDFLFAIGSAPYKSFVLPRYIPVRGVLPR